MTHQMTPQYRTMLFCDIYEDVNTFKDDYLANGIPPIIHYGETISGTVQPSNLQTLFYLLFGRYGNSPIANNDINQFKYKLFSIVFQFGPTWEKNLDIQAKLRALSENDIIAGTKTIVNTALNPSGAPSTNTLEELTMINQQNSSNVKRSKIDAYAMLSDLLKTDVTGDFLNRFNVLFKQFVMPEDPLLYITEYDEGEEDL